jgi:hypothetical protein
MDFATSGCATPQSSNPMFGANRLSLNRDTDSVVALTPNIKLVVRRSSLVVRQLAIDDRQRPTTWFLLRFRISMRSVRIHASRNHLGPLLMMQDRLNDLSRAPYDDGHNRNQPDSKIQYRSHVSVSMVVRRPSLVVRPWSLATSNWPTTSDRRPTTVSLVELTGIEPVASWLQTRRSPS